MHTTPRPDAPADPTHQRLITGLLLLCLLAITHGSLYPWVFQAPAGGWRPRWHRLWAWMEGPLWTTGGDVVGNVVLFIPLGMLAWQASSPWRRAWALRLGVVVAGGLLFATALQVGQIWLPTRSAAISDVVWNALGLVLGLAFSRWAQAPIAWLSRRLQSPHLLTYLMALFWLTLQWWPLLPLLHRQVLFSAWDRLQHLGSWAPLPTLVAALAFMVNMHLLRDLRGRLWLAVSLLFVAQVGLFFFVHKSGAVASEPSNALGGLLGLTLGGLCWSLSAQAATRVALLAAATGGLLSGLQPFQFNTAALPFQLVPVLALFDEPRVANTSAFLWEAFWILAVLLLAQRQGWRLPASAAVLTLVVAGLELLQRWLPGQQADITPLLLPTACAWFLWRLLRRQQRLRGGSPPTI